MEKNSNILICGTNWLGDSIISMPAIQLFKGLNPDANISILVKPALKMLWEAHSDIDEIITYTPSVSGTFVMSAELRKRNFDVVYIYPNSFRAAVMPFCARIPVRCGLRGKWRRMMLTNIVSADKIAGNHQVYEYFAIMGINPPTDVPAPNIKIKNEYIVSLTEKFPFDKNLSYAVLIPGAARGASKRWPKEYFIEVGRYLSEKGKKILVTGSKNESDLCEEVAAKCPGAISLAGKTSLLEFAATLKLSDIVVCNDSGGMHLASSVGTKVVAVFGITDPVKTGPLGNKSLVVVPDGVVGNRDIPRDSEYARKILKSIQPEKVINAINELEVF